jgi:cell division protein FtsB
MKVTCTFGITTNPKYNEKVKEILRKGSPPSKYAAQRIEELEQQNKAYEQENKKLREQNKAWEKKFESELDWFKPSITLVKPEKGDNP